MMVEKMNMFMNGKEIYKENFPAIRLADRWATATLMMHCIVCQVQQVLIRELTIRWLLTPLPWATTTCIESRARSSTSRKVTYSSTVRSMQAMTSPTHTIVMRARNSNWPVSVTSITVRKRNRRTARTSTRKDIGENVISSTITGAVADNLKIKGSYNNSKATISKLTKKMTANPITGRKAGVLTKQERKTLKSAISD